MTRRENTVELHQRIAELTTQGLTVPAIAERLHVNELGRAQSTIKRRFPGHTWTPEQCAEAANMARRLNQLGCTPNGWVR